MKKNTACGIVLFCALAGLNIDSAMAQTKNDWRDYSGIHTVVFNENTRTNEASSTLVNETTPEALVDKTILIDDDCYYFLNTGRRASFLIQKNKYLIIHDTEETTVSELATEIEYGLSDKYEIVTKHSLGDFVMISIFEGEDPEIVKSELLQGNPAISSILPILTSSDNGGQLVALSRIIVKIKNPSDIDNVIASLNNYNLTLVSRLHFTDTEYEFQINAPVSEAKTVFELTRAIAELPMIEWAEPNFLVDLQEAYTPNDTFYSNQWHLHNTGQNG
ncbi:MAG: hypothetical protein JRF40_08170, partial [Deltaproteobacteria bacterium]|nr:hypothetical protein [Deltaproteobacteria bacterium]